MIAEREVIGIRQNRKKMFPLQLYWGQRHVSRLSLTLLQLGRLALTCFPGLSWRSFLGPTGPVLYKKWDRGVIQSAYNT